jgi:hypothetical protein
MRLRAGQSPGKREIEVTWLNSQGVSRASEEGKKYISNCSATFKLL